MTLIFEHNVLGESTRVEFEVTDALVVHELLGYFVRFALAAGYQPESIKDAVIDLASEYEDTRG
jgi:hypothetical protein